MMVSLPIYYLLMITFQLSAVSGQNFCKLVTYVSVRYVVLHVHVYVHDMCVPCVHLCCFINLGKLLVALYLYTFHILL